MPYTAPTAAELKTAFPAFAAVDDTAVDFWIVRANRMVDTNWTEGDYQFAIMALAAHYMVGAGLGTGAEAEMNAQGMAGFKSIRSGQLSLTRGSAAENGAGDVPEEYSGTQYGRQFWRLLRLNRPSPRVAVSTDYPVAGYPYGANWPYW